MLFTYVSHVLQKLFFARSMTVYQPPFCTKSSAGLRMPVEFHEVSDITKNDMRIQRSCQTKSCP